MSRINLQKICHAGKAHAVCEKNVNASQTEKSFVRDRKTLYPKKRGGVGNVFNLSFLLLYCDPLEEKGYIITIFVNNI